MSGLFPELAPMYPQSQANRGKAFEAALELQFGRYKREGWLILRQYPPCLPIGDGEARLLGKAAPDYLLARKGLVFLVDAKSHQDERWPLSDLPQHQAAWFDQALASGNRAGVVLELQGQIWWLDWAQLGPAYSRWERGEAARGEGSLTLKNIASFGKKVHGFDFLAVAK